MQKYLIIIEEERRDKMHDLDYVIWTHTYCRSLKEKEGRAKSKVNGKLLRAWIVDWRDKKAEPAQMMGMSLSYIPESVSALIASVRDKGSMPEETPDPKPRIKVKNREPMRQPVALPPAPPPPPAKKQPKVKIYRPPYTLVGV